MGGGARFFRNKNIFQELGSNLNKKDQNSRKKEQNSRKKVHNLQRSGSDHPPPWDRPCSHAHSPLMVLSPSKPLLYSYLIYFHLWAILEISRRKGQNRIIKSSPLSVRSLSVPFSVSLLWSVCLFVTHSVSFVSLYLCLYLTVPPPLVYIILYVQEGVTHFI